MEEEKNLIEDYVDHAAFLKEKKFRSKMDNVQMAFYILAVLSTTMQLISDIILYKTVDLTNIALAIAVSFFYIGLALWSKNNPLLAIIGAIALFIIDNLFRTIFFTGSYIRFSTLSLGILIYLVVQAVEAHSLWEFLKRQKK